MKFSKTLAVMLLLIAPSSAVDQKSLLLGIAIGVGIYGYQGTRNHVILPVAHAMHRAMHPKQYQRINTKRQPTPRPVQK